MTTSQSKNGTAQWTIRWIVGALFAFGMAVSMTAYGRINAATELNTKMTTKHEAEIMTLKEGMKDIKAELKDNNGLIREFLITRYGYAPNKP